MKHTHKDYLQNILVKRTIVFFNKNMYVAISIFLAIILLEIYIIPISIDFILFGILIFYGFFIKLCKISSKATFYIALILLTIMSFEFLLSGAAPRTERIAVWVFLMLVFGVIHELRK